MRRRGSFIAKFALLALLLQALIPGGMMPDMGAHKGQLFALKICSGLGTKTIFVPADKYDPTAPHQAPAHDQAGKMPPCPFAVAALLSFTHPPLVAVAVLPPVKIAPLWPHDTLYTAEHFFGNASARAPPRLS